MNIAFKAKYTVLLILYLHDKFKFCIFVSFSILSAQSRHNREVEFVSKQRCFICKPHQN
jgi:hypothetical protein